MNGSASPTESGRAGAAGKPKRRARAPFLMRGESVVASIGIALVAILVAAVLACGGWLIRTQRTSLETARRQRIESVSQVIASSTEALLHDGRITPVRRMLMDVAERHELDRCRIIAPGGDVIAAADPKHITADLAQADWTGRFKPEPISATRQGTLSLHQPLTISDRGEAQLQITAPLARGGARLWEAQAGVGVVGVGALLALLVVYRQFRSRLRAMGVVREALLAMQRGETAESALAVAGDLGDEATAWNQLLDEQRQLRRKAVVEKTREAHGAAPVGSAELTSGCDAVPHGMLLIDEQMRIRYANNAAAVFLQTTREALTDADAAAVIEDEAITGAARDAVSGQMRRRATHEMQRSENGSAGVLRFSIQPVRRGERTTAMVVIDDVTQQRVAEQARHQFVAQATHELRTPLTNIRLYLDTLQEDAGDAQTRGQAMNVLNQETHRLERLVGDMLSVAEIEAGSLELRRDDVRLDALLNDIRSDYEAQARQAEVTLSFNLPPKLPIVQGDREKLMLALQNLVGNAIKYTPASGQVTVAAEASDGQLSIEVRDTGIGIAPEDIDQVFEKFYRAQDKRVSGTTGTGLGLALAREIVRLHGGDITAESRVDQGSVFTLTLPAHAEQATATEA